MSKDKRFFSHVTLKGYLGVFLMVAECLVFVALFAALNAAVFLLGAELGISSTVMFYGLTVIWLLIFLPLVFAEISPDSAEWSFDDFVRRYGLRKKKDDHA